MMSIILGVLACILATSHGTPVLQPPGVLPPARISFAVSSYTAAENRRFVNICIGKDIDSIENVQLTIKAEMGGSLLTQASDLLDFVPFTRNVSIATTDSMHCFNVILIDDHIYEASETFSVSFTINSPSTVAELKPNTMSSTIVTITDNDANDEKQCVVEDALSVMPFHTRGQSWISSYNFRGVCEHIFAKDCLGDQFTLVGDFLTRDLSTGRLGLQVPGGTLVLKEDGTYTYDGLRILQQTTSSIQFNRGVGLQTFQSGSDVIKHVVSIEGLGLSITRLYSHEGLNISGSFVISSHPSMSCELCGLCGRASTGKLVSADGTEVTDISSRNKLDAFENSYLIPLNEQTLHDVRIECVPIRNDTVIGDPLFEAAIIFQDRVFEQSLCYEIHGSSGKYYNLVSDDCVSVNALYTAMNDPSRGNIISAITIKAVNSSKTSCQEIKIEQNSATGVCDTSVQSGSLLSVGSNSSMGGIVVKQVSSTVVSVSVPNCENLPVEFTVTCETISSISQHMIRFEVTRGTGARLRPTSHGLLGQFWNVRITAEKLTDFSFIPQNQRHNYNLTGLYILTMHPPDGDTRTFIGENNRRTWDLSDQQCLYAGSSQGGPSGEWFSQYKDPVIEGNYRQYQVSSQFATNFMYSEFQDELCTA